MVNWSLKRQFANACIVVGLTLTLLWIVAGRYVVAVYQRAMEPTPTERDHQRMRSEYGAFVIGDMMSVRCKYIYVDVPLDIFTYQSDVGQADFQKRLERQTNADGWRKLPPIGAASEFVTEGVGYTLITRVLQLPNQSVVVSVRADRSTQTYQDRFQRQWAKAIGEAGGEQLSK